MESDKKKNSIIGNLRAERSLVKQKSRYKIIILCLSQVQRK